MPILEISVPAAGVPDKLSYLLPESQAEPNLTGRRARVTLRNRPVAGVIVGTHGESVPKIKPIESILDPAPVLTRQQIELCRFIASYYLAPLGEVLRLCLPPDAPRTLKKETLTRRNKTCANLKQGLETQTVVLNPEQFHAVEEISRSPRSTAFLLEGITGSGKTEVYIQAAKAIFEARQSVLIIVPEIALTPQLEQRFLSQLKAPILTWHSGLKPTDRREAIYDLLKGEPRIVLGARSALFAPLPNLGLIIVDEEHDPSFKQDDSPRYHARDIALWRAKNECAKIVLGSATPSLESRINVDRGRLQYLELSKRASAGSQLPTVEIIDLKSRSQHQSTKYSDRSRSEGHQMCILSAPLKEAIRNTLESGEQVLLFLNRRGFAHLAICDACGETAQCPHCSISLTYHEHGKNFCCHQCGYLNYNVDTCSKCHSGPILKFGLGTERVEQEARAVFPEYQTVRIDRDSIRTSKKLESTLAQIREGKAQIVIGTQMTAKGHDFPGLSLVGVILADIGLQTPDFRANERTFQLLTQVAGRAGRRQTQGRVLIQTFNPKHPVFEAVKSHDVRAFSKLDQSQRLEAKQPPFSKSALIRIESKSSVNSRQQAESIQKQIAQKITASKLQREALLLGPSPAPIEKIRNFYRWQLYLRTKDASIRSKLLSNLAPLKSAKLILDIDPVQML